MNNRPGIAGFGGVEISDNRSDSHHMKAEFPVIWFYRPEKSTVDTARAVAHDRSTCSTAAHWNESSAMCI